MLRRIKNLFIHREEELIDEETVDVPVLKGTAKNFRFPLIPDEEVRREVEEEAPVREQAPPPVKKESRSILVRGNRSFRPTKIPSPIYGFHERPQEEEEIVVEENPIVVEEIMELPEQENLMETDSVILEAEVEEPVQIEPEPKKVEINQARPTQAKQAERFVPYNVMMRKPAKKTNYLFPPLHLLQRGQGKVNQDNQWMEEQARLLRETLQSFNVGAEVVNIVQGPSVTRFEIQPSPGVKVNKITNLADDIKLGLAAKDIRIEAPIPGKSAIGIEVPNRTSRPVMLREILESATFRQEKSPLTVALGLDITGKPIITDIAKMPHGLIAGATGSGKSVCINAILLSILYKGSPDDVKVMLIDPKMVELAPYNNIPHLVTPVITDAKKATAALKWAVEEMERRYELLAHAGARNVEGFNKTGEKLPYIVIVIDELADLMMVAPADVEESIARIAQKARAAGIHLLVATQRPSVDVITGLIKANIPTRLAFTVSSQIDSRTIIDTNGADKLLGRGDMLFLENGTSKPIRAQGVFVSDGEIEQVVTYVKNQRKPVFLFEEEDLVSEQVHQEADDELFTEACQFVIEMGAASASGLQRRFRIGYNRAARLIDMMEAAGIISEAKGSKPREVLTRNVEES